MTNKDIVVSVVMPVYSEQKYIGNCIDSLLKQDYPLDKMEWIFVDGVSDDGTIVILEEYAAKYPGLIYMFSNPKRFVPHAMNIGIHHAQGKYIIRMDAHAEYAPDYISKCVYYLDTTDADNVGGVAETKAKGFIGNAIAKMLSSRFGVGDSQFRIHGHNGYVDTVPFGAFRCSVFEKLGLYDERLVRGEDNELNYRIRKNGGKIYLSGDIKFTYYCRDTICGIIKMAKMNGMWNVITMHYCPGSMGIRHFVPLVFVLSLFFLMLLGIWWKLFWWLFLAEMLLYFFLSVGFAVRIASGVCEFLVLPLLFLIFHVSYGFGSLVGMFWLISK